jgi:hypothetical protein
MAMSDFESFLEHISTVYSGWLCRFTMTWIHSVYLVAMTHLKLCNMSMGIPTSDDGILLCGLLIVCRFLTDVLLVSHTRTFYKVFRLSQVPTSYFGGNSATHYFGYFNDPLTNMCSYSQNILSS